MTVTVTIPYMSIPTGVLIEVVQDKKDPAFWFITDGDFTGLSIPKDRTSSFSGSGVGDTPEPVARIEYNALGMVIRIYGEIVYNAPPNMDSRDQKVLDAINKAYALGQMSFYTSPAPLVNASGIAFGAGGVRWTRK